jgi:diguanylate cyclase (GGDEF)-like protein
MSATILLVEDDEGLRCVVKAALDSAGYCVFEAQDVPAARRVLSKTSIDLVVTDIKLGQSGSGIDLLHELAPRSPDLAVVIMTGSMDIQTAIDCLREGAFDYLLKPFVVDELKAVVSRVLQRQRKMVAERDRVEEQIRTLGRFPSENPYPVLRVSKEGVILYANAASQALLDPLNCQVGTQVPPFLGQFITDVLGKGKRGDIEVTGAGRVFSFAVTPIKDTDYVYLYGHDITNLKAAEKELIRVKDRAQEMALHDALTGLPNRMLLEDRFEQAIAQTERTGKKLAVVFVDLDHFKQVNDTHGHRAGDQLLLTVAAGMKDAVRKTDTVARWGGDELVLLLPEVHGAQEARLVCERIKQIVQKEIAKAHPKSPLTMSMGIALYPDDGDMAETLLQEADSALYLAKSHGRNEVIIFGETEELKSYREKAGLRVLLSQALAARNIQVHYQPIVDGRSSRILGVEALARWYEPTVGWISPESFIPVAENAGLIYELGQQVMEQAMQQLHDWQRTGFSLSLSVNISIRQLFKHDFLKDLLELTAKFHLKPAQLVLEVTESQSLLGLPSEGKRLEELFQSGFHLSIDDFGQGYSSLSSLHAMPVSELKIDMKFVRNLHTEKGCQIVQAIVQMARTLNIQTVAEGVEDKDELAMLRQMGVQRMQGYLFSGPLPASEMLALLKSRPTLLPA